jgi:hypothetical protein
MNKRKTLLQPNKILLLDEKKRCHTTLIILKHKITV